MDAYVLIEHVDNDLGGDCIMSIHQTPKTAMQDTPLDQESDEWEDGEGNTIYQTKDGRYRIELWAVQP